MVINICKEKYSENLTELFTNNTKNKIKSH